MADILTNTKAVNDALDEFSGSFTQNKNGDISINIKDDSLQKFTDKYLSSQNKQTKKQVIDDLLNNREKSVIDDASYKDLQDYKNYIDRLKFYKDNPDELRNINKIFMDMQKNVQKARNDSILRQNQIQKTAMSELKANPSLTPKMLKDIINAKFQPSQEEINLTLALNNNQPLEARLSGYNIINAVENDINKANYTPDEYYLRLKNAGVDDEFANVLTKSYQEKDINLANEYIGEKILQQGVIDVREFNTNKHNGTLTNDSTKNAKREFNTDIGESSSRRDGTKIEQSNDQEISQGDASKRSLEILRSNSLHDSKDSKISKSPTQMERSKSFDGDEPSDARIGEQSLVSKQSINSDRIQAGINKALRDTNTNGENFIMKDNKVLPKSDYDVNVGVDEWVKELSQINNNELSANLFILANKHPELFKKPSDVYKLLIEIKNNPTHFFKNNRPDMALIAKELKDGSIGKLGVVKDSGYVGHISTSKNKNELERLNRVNERELGVGAPHPTLLRAEKIQAEPTAGVKTHSLANDIIPQTTQKTQTNINDEKFNKQFKKMQEIDKNAPELEQIKELYELKRKHNLEPFFYKWSKNPYEWRRELTRETELTNNFIDLKTKKHDDNFYTPTIRGFIQSELNIHPIKEFGINYAEFYHDGKNAINKLLAEKQGQVSGAFYRKELEDINSNGDIDLVWGDDKFGLRHILKRRSEQYGEEKALKFISHLDENIKNGEISYNNQKATIEIRSPQTTIILAKTNDNNFVLTAFRDRNNKDLATDKFVRSSSFTDKDVEFNAKDKSALLSNQTKSIIPQTTQKEQIKQNNIIETLTQSKDKLAFRKALINNKDELKAYLKGEITNGDYFDARGMGYFAFEKGLKNKDDWWKTADDRITLFLNAIDNNNADVYILTHPWTRTPRKTDIAFMLPNQNANINGAYKLPQNITDEIKQELLSELPKQRAYKIRQELGEVFFNNEPLSKELTRAYKDIYNKYKTIDKKAAKFAFGGGKESYSVKELQKAKDEFDRTRNFMEDFANNPLSDIDIMVKSLKDLKPESKQSFIKEHKEHFLNRANKIREIIERELNIHPIKDFGLNYAEFYHDGKNAIKKLLAEKQGQVSGAFYRQDLGDIDLVWGKVDANSNEGFGLAKITAKHPEITPDILDEIVRGGEIKQKANEAIQINLNNYKIILKSNWMGEPTQNKWIVTAYEKEPIISSDSFTKGNNTPLNSNDIIPQTTNQIKEIKSFDDIKNGFLQDMKQKKDEISQNNLKKSWNEKLYGKKDDSKIKINGKKVDLSSVEQYALKNELDPIKKEILKKEIIYEKLQDDLLNQQKQIAKITNNKELKIANEKLKNIQENIKEFKLNNMDDNGKIISDLEIC